MMYIVRNLCPYCSGEEYLFTYIEYATEFMTKLALDCIDKYNLDLNKEEVINEIDMWRTYPELCCLIEMEIKDKDKPPFNYDFEKSL